MSIDAGLWAWMKGGLICREESTTLVWPNESEIKRLLNIQPHLLNTMLIVANSSITQNPCRALAIADKLPLKRLQYLIGTNQGLAGNRMIFISTLFEI